jgi:hypothetical protein
MRIHTHARTHEHEDTTCNVARPPAVKIIILSKQKLLFYIYDVIVKQFFYKRSANHYSGGLAML